MFLTIIGNGMLVSNYSLITKTDPVNELEHRITQWLLVWQLDGLFQCYRSGSPSPRRGLGLPYLYYSIYTIACYSDYR